MTLLGLLSQHSTRSIAVCVGDNEVQCVCLCGAFTTQHP